MEGFRARAIASARSGVWRDARDVTRLASRGGRARRARARRGGRRASEGDGAPDGRNPRVEDGDRATHHHETANGALLRGERGGRGDAAAGLADRGVTQTGRETTQHGDAKTLPSIRGRRRA